MRLCIAIGVLICVSRTEAQELIPGARHYPETTNGEFAVKADTDLDGDLDLIELENQDFFGSGFYDFSAWDNTGNGDFLAGSSQSLMTPGSGGGQAGAQSADLDGDGYPELIVNVGQLTDAKLRIWKGGPNGFGSSTLHDFGALYITQLLAADREGDGISELIVVMTTAGFVSTELRWFSLVGDQLVSGPPKVLANNSAILFSAAEINGDGLVDLVAFNNTFSKVLLFPSTSDSFTGPSELAQGILPNDPNKELSVGDLEGDGDVDVVAFVWVPTFPNDQMYLVIYENQGGVLQPGVTQLLAKPSIPFLGFAADPFALVDWDMDGDLDIAMNTVTLKWLVNDGHNQFHFEGEVRTISQRSGPGAADFDSDGWPDYVTTLSAFFGTGDFPRVLTAEATLGYPQAFVYSELRDWEDDGDLDLFTNSTVRANDGGGVFASAQTQLAVISPGPAYSYGPSVIFSDFSGDGLPDLLVRRSQTISVFQVLFKGMALAIDDGGGHYYDSGLLLGPANPVATPPDGGFWPVADLDLDGDQDLLVADGAHINLGTGLTPKQSVYEGTPVLVADFDHNGVLELLTKSADSLLLYSFSAGTLVPTLLAEGLVGSVCAVQADADDDGQLDLLISANAGNDLRIFPLQGSSFGSPVVITAPGTGTTPLPLVVRDLDADGLSDLLLLRRPTGNFLSTEEQNLVSLRRTGPGLVYAPAREWIAGSGRDLVDVDSDGDLDLVGGILLSGSVFTPPSNGHLRQYGTGSPGTGAAVPLLGATGPLRPASTSAALHLRRALGGAPSLLAIGAVEAYKPDLPFVGMTTYLDGLIAFALLPLSGPLGGTGDGAFDIPINVDTSFSGLSFFHQVYVFDPASPSLFTASNGLELSYGF